MLKRVSQENIFVLANIAEGRELQPRGGGKYFILIISANGYSIMLQN